MTRLVSAAVVTCASLLALPAVGHASTPFGSRLNHDPANSGECKDLLTPCSLVSYIHPSDPDGDPYSGGAPVNGVITRFRIRAFGENGPTQVTFRLARIGLPNPQDKDVALATAAGRGPTVTIPGAPATGDVPISEFPGRLSVKKGDHLAIDGTDVWATYNTDGSKFTYRYDPPLIQAQGPRSSNDSRGELLVAAVIEPDADRDGFGDETQDTCPNSPSSAPPCVKGDTTNPRLSNVKLTRKGVAFKLSEDARVTLRLKKNGRTIKKRTVNGDAGSNRLGINRQKLGEGRYAVVLSARDAAGNGSAAKRLKLRVTH